MSGKEKKPAGESTISVNSMLGQKKRTTGEATIIVNQTTKSKGSYN